MEEMRQIYLFASDADRVEARTGVHAAAGSADGAAWLPRQLRDNPSARWHIRTANLQLGCCC